MITQPMTPEFIVTSEAEPLSEHVPARLYRINEQGHGVLHAQGNLGMMQNLAEQLNTKGAGNE